MIVIKLEMWPKGDESKAYTLGRTYLWNDGTGGIKRRNYEVAVRRKGQEVLRVGQHPRDGALRQGTVRDYPAPSYNIWRLVIRALKDAFPEET